MKKVDEKVLNSDLVFLKSLDQPDPASYRAGYEDGALEECKKIVQWLNSHEFDDNVTNLDARWFSSVIEAVFGKTIK